MRKQILRKTLPGGYDEFLCLEDDGERSWERFLPAEYRKHLTDKYIFHYSEHHKSGNFPLLWRRAQI